VIATGRPRPYHILASGEFSDIAFNFAVRKTRKANCSILPSGCNSNAKIERVLRWAPRPPTTRCSSAAA
jgi:hypothetical protein